ncbi:uncharacterized protein A4U43_C08F27880 [Asparagus officinalis]|nr:uncharacterized protein A4U43_C08F27880 [Asparagus officinalis]
MAMAIAHHLLLSTTEEDYRALSSNVANHLIALRSKRHWFCLINCLMRIPNPSFPHSMPCSLESSGVSRRPTTKISSCHISIQRDELFAGISPDIFTNSILIGICSSMNRIALGFGFFCSMLEQKYTTGVKAFNVNDSWNVWSGRTKAAKSPLQICA